MKKTKIFLPLLMAIVMMAMSPTKVWADEPDARFAQLTLSDGVTATITDNDSHPWVKVTPGETLNGTALPDEITNGLRSNIVGVDNTTSTTTITLTATKDFKLSFKVYCSSESNCDYCQVFVDNVEKCKLSGGNGADYTFTAFLSSGEHTIRLFYKKDTSVNSGIDSGVIYDFKTVSVCDTHTWGEWTETLAPTCTEKGSHYHTCSVCEITKTEDIPALGHTMQEVAGKAAGRCDNPGHLAHYHCTLCDMDFADQVGTMPTTVSLLITSHVSLDEDGLCPNCHVGNPTELSEDGYYKLSTAADLAWFRDFVNTYVLVNEQITYPYASANARLMADINMSSICHAADAENSVEKLSWVPIGNINENHYLGTFDGNNHEVTNLYIDSDKSWVGFIGYLGGPNQETGTVKNLTVRGSVKSSQQYIGGIVGYSFGTISGCINYATVEGTGIDSYYIGGIAGTSSKQTGTAKIENCANYGEIKCNSTTSQAGIAGIAGWVQNTVITNCCNYEKVVTSGYNAGGIAGYIENSTIRQSINSGSIISNNAEYNYVGGIIGYIHQTTNIEECKNTGNVTGVGQFVGGIVGEAMSNVSIKNSGNEGTITSSVGYDYGTVYSYTGGIVGSAYAESSFFDMSGCYNTGTISAAGIYVGGLAGNINSSNSVSYVNNCYTTGSVISTTTDSYAYIGGAFGCISFPVMNNIYSAATITKNAAATVDVGAFAGINQSVLTNCYYDSDKSELHFYGAGNTIDQSVNGGKSTTEFASGEICYLFNGSRSAGTAESPLLWYQGIGRDATPTFEQNQYAIVKYDATNGYYNDIENFASIEIQDGVAYEAKLKRTADQLTYTRTFANTTYNALYVPFAMQYSDWSEKADVYRLLNIFENDNDDNGTIDEWVLKVVKLKSGESTKANTPYIIKPKQEGDMEITLQNVTLARAEEKSYWCASLDYKFVFTGSYAEKAIAADSYFFVSTTGGLQYAASAETLNPQRWYMGIYNKDTDALVAPSTFNPTNNSAKAITIICDDEEATDISLTPTLSEGEGVRKLMENGKIVIVKNGVKYNVNGQVVK